MGFEEMCACGLGVGMLVVFIWMMRALRKGVDNHDTQ